MTATSARRARRGLRPDALLSSVTAIRAEWLQAQGVRALLLDLDNTLVPRGESRVPAGICTWAAGLERAGVRLCILSNTEKPRLAAAGKQLGVPVVGGALKPFARGYVSACMRLDVVPREAAMVGDQSYTDILGAHLVGMRAYLVEPLGTEDLPHTRLLRGIDRLAARGMMGKGRGISPHRQERISTHAS